MWLEILAGAVATMMGLLVGSRMATTYSRLQIRHAERLVDLSREQFNLSTLRLTRSDETMERLIQATMETRAIALEAVASAKRETAESLGSTQATLDRVAKVSQMLSEEISEMRTVMNRGVVVRAGEMEQIGPANGLRPVLRVPPVSRGRESEMPFGTPT